ncbi:Cytochrome P450 [Mycena kentingensis (nom. inval.)]|nr:Cytochrome P450 [Mycena kentingensis (nom. inval.)]
MDSTTTIALGATLVLSLSLAVYHIGKPTPLPGIPHNKLHWFTGDIPLLTYGVKEKGAITWAFDDTAKRLGPVSQVVVGLGASWASRLFGFGQAIVILADAQEMQDVLVNRSAEFERSTSITSLFAATVPHGLIALPTNDEFRHHRRYLGITMTTPYIARMVPRMVDLIQELIDLWTLASKRLSGPTDALNAYDDIRSATIDIIASITFGASFNGGKTAYEYLEAHPELRGDARPESAQLPDDLQILLDTIGDGVLFPAPRLLPWITRTFNRKWRAALQRSHAFLKARLDGAREEYRLDERDEKRPAAAEADNVLDMILEKEKADQLRGTDALTETEIIDELLVFALGGSETTATTMQWGLKILSKHPRVQRTLRAELLTLPSLSSGAPTLSELGDESKAPYLSAVVHELLRCSRSASAVARDATRDTTLLGHHIPKGTQVLLPIGMVQQLESAATTPAGLDGVRSKTSWRKTGFWDAGDVGEFKPERWLRAEDGSFDPNAGPYMPFSFGLRGCFGQKLAVAELRLFFGMMQMAFLFDEVPAELNTWAAQETVTNHPLQCYVRPIPWEEVERRV